MEKEANQLYRRPQMTGQARDEEVTVGLCWHALFRDSVTILVPIECRKHFISVFCWISVKLTFSTPPSQKARARSSCQVVTMTTSENVILYD